MSIKFDFTGLSRDIITLKNNYLNQQKEFFEDHGFDLHYFNARMFDSQLGRFHSNDPLIIFASPYNGMGNNPVSLVDPTGMIPGLDGWSWGFGTDGTEDNSVQLDEVVIRSGGYLGNRDNLGGWRGYSGGRYQGNHHNNGLGHGSGGNGRGGRSSGVSNNTSNSSQSDNSKRQNDAQVISEKISLLEKSLEKSLDMYHDPNRGKTVEGFSVDFAFSLGIEGMKNGLAISFLKSVDNLGITITVLGNGDGLELNTSLNYVHMQTTDGTDMTIAKTYGSGELFSGGIWLASYSKGTNNGYPIESSINIDAMGISGGLPISGSHYYTQTWGITWKDIISWWN